MFRLLRTALLVMFAFVAGLLFERSQTAEACVAAGGTMSAGLCKGAS